MNNPNNLLSFFLLLAQVDKGKYLIGLARKLPKKNTSLFFPKKNFQRHLGKRNFIYLSMIKTRKQHDEFNIRSTHKEHPKAFVSTLPCKLKMIPSWCSN